MYSTSVTSIPKRQDDFLSSHKIACPGCKRRIITHQDIASLNHYGIYEYEPTEYLLEKYCANAMTTGTEAQKEVLAMRIENRLKKDPDKYTTDGLSIKLGYCPNWLAKAKRRAVFINNDEDVSWKEDDRRWFENNPGRAHRLRRQFSGEMPFLNEWVIVQCIYPGIRMKYPAQFITDEQAQFLENQEDVLHWITLILDESYNTLTPDWDLIYRQINTIILRAAMADTGKTVYQ